MLCFSRYLDHIVGSGVFGGTVFERFPYLLPNVLFSSVRAGAAVLVFVTSAVSEMDFCS